MELANTNIKVKTNHGEITSIKYKKMEILYQGNHEWKKTFPVIFPVVGVSKYFQVDGQNFKIPKHGFWKSLNWDSFIENQNIVLVATHIANDIYPFTIDIQQFISIFENRVQIKTHISNLSKKTAYFHFGYHPGFNIDKSSKLITSSKKNPLIIDSKGKLRGKHKLEKEFIKEPFGEKFDTIVYKNIDVNSCSFKYKNHIISVEHDANNLQIWKPKNDMFICIEPWYGAGDNEEKLIKEAKNKKEINSLNFGKTWKAVMTIKIKDN